MRGTCAAGLCAALAACGSGEPGTPADEGATAPEPGWRYERGITFVGLNEAAVAAPFAFRVKPQGERHEREMRAWLARGETWDPFIDVSWSAAPTGGVWRVVPHGELRIAAGGPGLEALWYDSGGRRLRLELGEPQSGWQGGDRKRFRLLDGTLTVGSEALTGIVVEELQVTPAPAAGATAPSTAYDRLVLLDESGFRLYLLHERIAGESAAGAEGTSWAYIAGAEDAYQEAAVEWVEVRSVEEARRDVPLHWRFESAEADVAGEVTAIGYHTTVGAERGGRRAVEVRYSVEGWLESGGERVEVRGVVRHEQW